MAIPIAITTIRSMAEALLAIIMAITMATITTDITTTATIATATTIVIVTAILVVIRIATTIILDSDKESFVIVSFAYLRGFLYEFQA